MHRTSTIVVGIVSSVFVATAASADITVDLGVIRQLSPRPTLDYSGAYAACLASRVDASGARTIVTFNLAEIVDTLGGGLALSEVRVRDAGGNSYGNWSPGADIDLCRIVGGSLSGQIDYRYTGVVAQHAGESSLVLGSRIADLDAVTGDQHYNSTHFVSLGQGGVVSMAFSGFLHSGGSSSDSGSGSGGSGPGGYNGGGQTPVYGGLLVASGMMLEVGEAGLGEGYGVELVFTPAAVPAPGAIALLALAGVVGRRRR